MSEQAVFEALKYRIEVDMCGTRRYYNSAGQLHRENGPAVEWTDGDKLWYQNGQLHRTDGPAVENADGTKAWHQYGRPHRTDGAAIERADGSKYWYINDVCLSEDEYDQAVNQKQNV